MVHMAPHDSGGGMMQRYNHTAQATVYVTVKLVISGAANPHEVVADADYSFDHEAIVSSEIIGAEEQ
jgi:hypothetical protein